MEQNISVVTPAQAIRKSDYVGRCGRGEFLIILQNIKPETLEKLAEKICTIG
ncbi:MAG: diguanylate cyclase [Chloroflexi bacterium]|uniref:Diguanylate cyclase n=1 Tax=Candidatus Chlorohelix allophototropha TaxID=3003348 RepID=A0A8T7LUJ3_9CHLR|nr:diguanylate cyclase [Chloroflexota bacterium]